MIRKKRRPRRRGNTLVLTAVMMIVLMGMLAFALDLGYLYVTRTQMQRSADAAALAAAWELVDNESLVDSTDTLQSSEKARQKAVDYATRNPVLTTAPQLGEEDVKIGFLANPSDPSSQMNFDSANRPNAVWVNIRRDTNMNGEVSLFFAPLLGRDRVKLQSQATAAVNNNIRGFRTPSDGSNLGILPITLDEPTWNALLAGVGTDDWKWDAELENVTAGADGVLEVNLYPQSTGSPGNRGMVDIGSSSNSTADIARQILHGASPADLAHHGGKIELDENGELILNGDTGISAGVKDELASILGETRIIPVFRSVVGPGNNAQYTIVAFVGIRIMEVKLTGKNTSKRVIIQPAKMVTIGAIPSSSGDTTTSYYVFSPPWLVR